MSAGPGSGKKSWCRRCLPCIGCLALVALIVGLSVGLTKNPITTAQGLYDDLEETYDEYFGDKRDDPTEKDRGSIAVTSNEFDYGEPLPAQFTADGEDISPPLKWSGLPFGTVSLVVLVEDHDYPTPDRPASYPWVHWVAYDVNPYLTGLPESMVRDADVAEVVDPSTGETMSAGAPLVVSKADPNDLDAEDNVEPGDLHQGSTSWGDDAGYRGPDPPEGQPGHRYYFRVLALDGTVEDKVADRAKKDFVSYDDILEVVEGDDAKVKVLAFGLLMGTYQKK